VRGVELLRGALATGEETGWLFCYPEFMGMLAEGEAALGQPGDALVTIGKAMARARDTGEGWYDAELMRLKGEFTLQDSGAASSAAAELAFREALDIAETQGALFWVLRAALSLARLRLREGRTAEAKDTLAPVYARFAEGFTTADLRAARALLERPPG
jgi:predicted ATPase